MAMFGKTHRSHCMLGEDPLGHIPQNPLPDTLSACGIFMQSAEKSDDASYAQALFSIAFDISPAWKVNEVFIPCNSKKSNSS